MASRKPIARRSAQIAAAFIYGLLILASSQPSPLKAADTPAKTESEKINSAETTPAVPAPAAASEPTPVSKTEPATTENKTFELHVVGPEGKPVPGASVEFRTDPTFEANQILKGKFIKSQTEGAQVITDNQGQLTFETAKTIKYLAFVIVTPGYAPYSAVWSAIEQSEEIPQRFTAELDAGWSVGGMIVDNAGIPVAGAEVYPSLEFKKRPGDLRGFHLDVSATTDAAGKWRFDSVPASQATVSMRICHPRFQPKIRGLTRREFGLELGQEPQTKIELSPGLTVTGKVTDETGQPIAGASVQTQFSNDQREAKTGKDGMYQLVGCEAETARILVFAKGRATDMQQVRVAEGMAPVNFQLQPGRKVRIRVVDEKGEPAPGARIALYYWRGSFAYFEFDHINQYANKAGIWEWNEAPLDAFEVDICSPGAMQLSKQQIVARDEEYVFQPPPALEISGTVIDAETKQPIKAFKVIPGMRSSKSHLHWMHSEAFESKRGQYDFKNDLDCLAHLVRIETEGYLPAVSRDIKGIEGKVKVNFELKPGKHLDLIIRAPDGKPAVDAEVALGIAGSQIHIKDGNIDDRSTDLIRKVTDDAGKVQFPPQEAAFRIVVTHSTGFAHVEATAETVPEAIQLEPWAKVEGLFRVGKSIMPNVKMTLMPEGGRFHGDGTAHIDSWYEATTDKDGHYSFDRVMPGYAQISRLLDDTVANEGAVEVASTSHNRINLVGGETAKLDIGGTGRPVIGKLEPPKGFEGKIEWNFAFLQAVAHVPMPPKPAAPVVPAEIRNDRAKTAQWMQQWQSTPAGQKWQAWNASEQGARRLREVTPYFHAKVATDGTFRIDDVPAGTFALSIHFFNGGPGRMQMQDCSFTVPEMKDNRSEEPLDLGVLTIK